MKTGNTGNALVDTVFMVACLVFLFFCGNVMAKLGAIEEHLAVIATCSDQLPDEPEP